MPKRKISRTSLQMEIRQTSSVHCLVHVSLYFTTKFSAFSEEYSKLQDNNVSRSISALLVFHAVDFFFNMNNTDCFGGWNKSKHGCVRKAIALPSRQKERKKKGRGRKRCPQKVLLSCRKQIWQPWLPCWQIPRSPYIPCTTHFYGISRQPFCGFSERSIRATHLSGTAIHGFPESRHLRFITVWPSICLLHAGFLLFALLPVRRVAWKERND